MNLEFINVGPRAILKVSEVSFIEIEIKPVKLGNKVIAGVALMATMKTGHIIRLMEFDNVDDAESTLNKVNEMLLSRPKD